MHTLSWTEFQSLTHAMHELCIDPKLVDQSRIIAVIERFVVLLYDRTSDAECVDVCRKHLFARKGRSMESIPPTRDALVQHVKRACFQVVFIWNTALQSCPTLPSPSEWGWMVDGGKWNPVWMTLPQASKICMELLKCGCKTGCTRNCKCSKAFMKCTSLCYCGGECDNPGLRELGQE